MIANSTWILLVAICSGLVRYGTEACPFGSGCTYECHCQEGDNCGSLDGSCPNGCDEGNLMGPTDLYYTAPWTGYGCQYGNVAYLKSASNGPSTLESNDADFAVDGNHARGSGSCAVATDLLSSEDAYWIVDLGRAHVVEGINVTIGDGAQDTLSNTRIAVSQDRSDESQYELCAMIGSLGTTQGSASYDCSSPLLGQYVRLKRDSTAGASDPSTLTVCEVQVFGYVYEECTGFFTGVACATPCNCVDACDVISGVCPTQCNEGWSGSDCQISDNDGDDTGGGGGSNTAIIVGVVVVLLLLAIIGVAIGVGVYCFRRRVQQRKNSSMDPIGRAEDDAGNAYETVESNFGGNQNKPVKTKQLSDYIYTISHMQDGFKKEYMQVAKAATSSAANTNGEVEVSQNGVQFNYINACYMKGFPNQQYAMIMSPGPIGDKAVSFWRLVWETNATCIVCLMTPEEMKKTSCWPGAIKDYYGKYEVQIGDNSRFIHYQTTDITLSFEGQNRNLSYIHYTGWPAGMEPVSAGSLLEAREQVRQRCGPGPVILYGSPTFGRSGTYAAVDFCCEQAVQTGKVDIFNYAIYLRTQCPSVDQTLKQYRFQYTATLDHVCSQPHGAKATGSKRDEEFQSLEKLRPDYSNQEDEDLSGNINPMALVEPNSPVDAVFVDSPMQGRAYIACGLPADTHVEEFWSPIFTQQSDTLVVMADVDKGGDKCWPSSKGEPMTIGSFTIEVVEDEQTKHVTCRNLKVTRKIQPHPVTQHMKQYIYMGWKEAEDTPPSPDHLLQLLGPVHKWHLKGKSTTNAPITVVCRTGVHQSGLFCASSILWRSFQKSGTDLDVFNTVKKVRLSRPDFIRQAQYKFLYDLAGALSK